MPAYRTLDDLDARDRIVLVRADFNVPMKAGRVTDATRIRRGAETLRELSAAGARVVALSHLGRPKGAPDAAYSLKPVVPVLAEALDLPVAFGEDCIGPAAQATVAGLQPGAVALLENLRFHEGEEANDADFVAALAALGQIYVNDAFSAAHRAHASTEGLAHRLPAYAGRLMAAELDALGRALEQPQRPAAALVGGAKVSTKLALLGNLVGRLDLLVIGGAMANTFLAAQGRPIGKSLAEPDLYDTARDILARAAAAGCTVLLPEDAVVAPALQAGAPTRVIALDDPAAADTIGDGMILDIGPRTVAAILARLETCRTVLWNGPMGAFETAPFQAGTVAIARAVAEATARRGIVSVAGGGDTVAALEAADAAGRLTYVSSAGGAFLEWLEGRTLPGVAALAR